MYKFKNGLGYFNEDLPVYGGCRINRRKMVGMVLSGVYKGVSFDGLNLHEYISNCKENKNHAQFIGEYRGKAFIKDCCGFLQGEIGNIIDAFIDINKKRTIDGVVHISIMNTNGERFLALYSGDNAEKVINSNWSIQLVKNNAIKCVSTSNYNKTGTPIYLHQVDLGSWVDHINNDPLDNRIENLRKSNPQHNAKNKRSRGITEITGLIVNGRGWIGRYWDKDSHSSINTRTRCSISEAKIDCLIAQRYMGYKHNEDLFYLLDDLSTDRIKEVEDLLEKKIQKARNKIHKEREYKHDIEECDGYYKLKKNGKEMLFDCDLDFIKNKNIYENKNYWECRFSETGYKNTNKFHKELLGIKPNEYLEYNIHIDHLNGMSNDNRYKNLMITTNYSNQCNKKGNGYCKLDNGVFKVYYMGKYKFWDLVTGLRIPYFKTEQESINEVNRRREIIERSRVKLKSKQELDELITYCLDNKYILENGLADLDLGYLYWKGILKIENVA